MSDYRADPADIRATFDRVLGEVRPKLHRYCARMTGSAIDGEDVVQDALVKALEAIPQLQLIAQIEGWLFRIAHNAALDFLRRRGRRDATFSDEDVTMAIDPVSVVDDRQVAAASLRTFMRLPVAQRSSVILKDVLGYSLEEIGGVIEASLPAVKAALHRGRAQLREFAREPEDVAPPALAQGERARLDTYIARFNARDFDAIRNMLADDVRLDLVARKRSQGRIEVGSYFHNYGRVHDWRMVAGTVDGRAAALVLDPEDPQGRPTYFVVLDWTGEKLALIRDFRYARYALDGAEIRALG
ncbi:MAG: sigma-70 family RNA polymerase sigma factor [Stellaceae bacterium]